VLGLNVKTPTYCIFDSFNCHMATSVDASPLNTTTCCHVKRQWSGRESRACPPTYGRQLGSTRSQLLLWVSLRLCLLLLLSLRLPAAHRQGKRCIVLQVTRCVSLSRQLPRDLMWFLLLSSFCLTERSVSQATAGSAGNYWCRSSPALALDHLSEHITL